MDDSRGAGTNIIYGQASLKPFLCKKSFFYKMNTNSKNFSFKFAANQSQQIMSAFAVSNDCNFVKIILRECDGLPTLSK